MEITEVRIKLMDEPGDRLKAFCSITFDHCFVVRDLKIIEGGSGPFVAMPSRKLTAHCHRCGSKNHLRAQYCNQCGATLPDDRLPVDSDGRAKLYADIAHPINSSCREMIQNFVIREYEDEVERAKQPGYISRYDDFDNDLGSEGRAASKQLRVDQSHGNTEAAMPPRSKSTKRSENQRHDSQSTGVDRFGSSEGGFGAGIFPE